jgi:hypothetical protein
MACNDLRNIQRILWWAYFKKKHLDGMGDCHRDASKRVEHVARSLFQ